MINPVKEGETKLIAKTTDGGYTAYFTLTVKDIVADGESAVTCKPDMVAGIISDEAVTKVTLKCDKETPTVDADVLKTIFDRSCCIFKLLRSEIPAVYLIPQFILE